MATNPWYVSCTRDVHMILPRPRPHLVVPRYVCSRAMHPKDFPVSRTASRDSKHHLSGGPGPHNAQRPQANRSHPGPAATRPCQQAAPRRVPAHLLRREPLLHQHQSPLHPAPPRPAILPRARLPLRALRRHVRGLLGLGQRRPGDQLHPPRQVDQNPLRPVFPRQDVAVGQLPPGRPAAQDPARVALPTRQDLRGRYGLGRPRRRAGRPARRDGRAGLGPGLAVAAAPLVAHGGGAVVLCKGVPARCRARGAVV